MFDNPLAMKMEKFGNKDLLNKIGYIFSFSYRNSVQLYYVKAKRFLKTKTSGPQNNLM